MKEIELTRGYVALVDDEDFAWLNQWKWHALKIPRVHCVKLYAARNECLVKIYMHRELLKAPNGLLVDHIDGNGLNNVRDNLRLANSSQNSINTHHEVIGTSKYIGVTFLDPMKPQYVKYSERPYKAYIRVGQRCTHLGYFKTAEAAARARDAEARMHHGEFARLNFPEAL